MVQTLAAPCRGVAPSTDRGKRVARSHFRPPHIYRGMDKFVRSQNVERYRRLLRTCDRRIKTENQIIKLLAEERQKQKDAGDLVW